MEAVGTGLLGGASDLNYVDFYFNDELVVQYKSAVEYVGNVGVVQESESARVHLLCGALEC